MRKKQFQLGEFLFLNVPQKRNPRTQSWEVSGAAKFQMKQIICYYNKNPSAYIHLDRQVIDQLKVLVLDFDKLANRKSLGTREEMKPTHHAGYTSIEGSTTVGTVSQLPEKIDPLREPLGSMKPRQGKSSLYTPTGKLGVFMQRKDGKQ